MRFIKFIFSILKIIGIALILSLLVYPIVIFLFPLPRDSEAAAIGAFVTQILVFLSMLPISAVLLYARELLRKKNGEKKDSL